MESIIEESIKEKIDIKTLDIGAAHFVEVDFLEDYKMAKKLFSKFPPTILGLLCVVLRV